MKKKWMVCLMVALVVTSGVLIVSALTRGHTVVEVSACYAQYSFESQLNLSDRVAYGHVLSRQDARWTLKSPVAEDDESQIYTITTDYVVELFNESGRSLGTVILRDGGGTVGDTTYTYSTGMKDIIKVNEWYLFCLNQYPERSGVTYKVKGQEVTYDVFYVTVASPNDSIFVAQEQSCGVVATLAESSTFTSLSGRFSDKTLADFRLTSASPEN